MIDTLNELEGKIEVLENLKERGVLTEYGRGKLDGLNDIVELVKNLTIQRVSQRSELFFAVLKWAKQADLEYPDEILIKDFEQFTAKNCG